MIYLEKGDNHQLWILSLPFELFERKNSWKDNWFSEEKNVSNQDVATAHKIGLTMSNLNKLKYGFLEHPLHSPDLASTYYYFRNLK